jgi:hypothetical protein
MHGPGDGSEGQFLHGVTKITELLAEKHKLFDWRNFETGKLLQKNGREEMKDRPAFA